VFAPGFSAYSAVENCGAGFPEIESVIGLKSNVAQLYAVATQQKFGF
jgi:hypothetical protein